MMANLIATPAVLLVWAIVGPAIAGVGRWVRWAIKDPATDAQGWLDSFWLGLAAVLLIIQGWVLVAPINTPLLGLVLVLGLAGLLINWRPFLPLLAGRWKTILVAGLAVIWIANRATGPTDIGDSGLYHFAVMHWANQYGTVTGLGNLSPAFAINNSSLLLTALLNVGPLAGRGEHFVNGLLLAVMAVQAVVSISRLLRAGGSPATRVFDIFSALLIGPILLYALGREASTPTTDWPAGVMLIAMAGLWLRSWDRPTPAALFGILFLGAAAVTIKLSAIVFAAGVGLCALASVRWRGASRDLRRAAVAGLAGGIVLVGLWTTRNVIQTGYPLYPSGALGLNVPWRLKTSDLAFLYDAIVQHAKGGMQLWLSGALQRTPLRFYANLMKPPFATRADVAGLNWLPSWMFAQVIVGPVELVTPLVMGLAMIWPAWKTNRRRVTLLLVATLPAAIFWLLQSPDRRYVWATMWTLGGGLCALALATGDRRRWAISIALACGLVAVGYRVGLLTVLRSDNPLKQIPFVLPGPDHGFYPRPTADLSPWQSRWGVTVFTNAPDAPDGVWDHEQPAAAWPAPDPNLRLRRPGNLAGGFILDDSPSPAPAATNPEATSHN